MLHIILTFMVQCFDASSRVANWPHCIAVSEPEACSYARTPQAMLCNFQSKVCSAGAGPAAGAANRGMGCKARLLWSAYRRRGRQRRPGDAEKAGCLAMPIWAEPPQGCQQAAETYLTQTLTCQFRGAQP